MWAWPATFFSFAGVSFPLFGKGRAHILLLMTEEDNAHRDIYEHYPHLHHR
jgi:hypothetical protein